MNGKRAKALRRATGFDPNAEPTYRATPTRAYVVQSFVVVGAINWLRLYRKVHKVVLTRADEARSSYRRAKRLYRRESK